MQKFVVEIECREGSTEFSDNLAFVLEQVAQDIRRRSHSDDPRHYMVAWDRALIVPKRGGEPLGFFGHKDTENPLSKWGIDREWLNNAKPCKVEFPDDGDTTGVS